MKNYGAMKATEFTKKQVNVIFACNKQGKIKVSDKAIKKLYNLADFYNYDDNGNVEILESFVLIAIENLFDNDYESAQESLDQFESFI